MILGYTQGGEQITVSNGKPLFGTTEVSHSDAGTQSKLLS